jgi:hypothetical protein
MKSESDGINPAALPLARSELPIDTVSRARYLVSKVIGTFLTRTMFGKVVAITADAASEEGR